MKKALIGFVLIILSFLLIVGLNAGSSATQNASIQTVAIPTPKPANLDADKLWSLIQSWRQSQRLTPYIKDQRLCNLADARIDELKYKSHQDYNHSQLPETANKFLPANVTVSENITGGADEADMLDRWLHSASHSAALHRDYKYSCVAVWGNRPIDNSAVQEFSNF